MVCSFRHIFRRLRWLDNKPLAHLATLFYLAIWHGYHLGYFLLFASEFACMVAQEQVSHFFGAEQCVTWITTE